VTARAVIAGPMVIRRAVIKKIKKFVNAYSVKERPIPGK